MLTNRLSYCFNFIGLSSTLLLPSQPALWVSSNVSFTASISNGLRLGAWPTHLPWSFDLGPELKVTILHYGRYATQTMLDQVRDGLRNAQRWFGDPSFPYVVRTRKAYRFGCNVIVFDCDPVDRDIVQMSPGDILSILQAIEGFFFLYQDGPREFSTNTLRPTLTTYTQSLSWRVYTDGWPVTLPFMFCRVGIEPGFWEGYQYGAELEPSSKYQVEQSLEQVEHEIHEGKRR